jgi:hypothetical protein
MTQGHAEANWTQALAEMREAPAKPAGSKSFRQAIESAIDEIISCRERGHTDADILAILARNGIQMSLNTFRQYVRQARRAKARQAPEGKSKSAPISNAQTSDIRSRAQTTNAKDSRETDATRRETPVTERVDRPKMSAAISQAHDAATPISQAVAKPPRQTGMTAAEALGHRFDQDV